MLESNEKTQDLIEIDLWALLRALYRKGMWILLAALAGGVLALIVTRTILTPKYTSTISLYVNNTAADGQAGAALNLNDLNASQKLVNTYIVILQNDEVLGQVADRLMEEYTEESLAEALPFSETEQGLTLAPSALRDVLTMRAVNSTEVLEIKAETPNPDLSARICALMAEVAPDVLRRVVKAGSVESIGQAVPATRPSSPNTLLNTLLGCTIVAVLAAAVVLVIHLRDNTVKDEQDFKRRFQEPLLGEIPDFEEDIRTRRKVSPDQPVDESSPRYRINLDTPFRTTEAYKQVRTNLLFSLAGRESRVIAISSALPGEGKSTTCANLAITLAQTGARTLLIDADLRKPVQHKLFVRPNVCGLSNLLVGQCPVGDALHEGMEPYLDLITAGSIPPNPSELMGSNNIQILLERLAQDYEYIVIDTPPINVVPDAVILANVTAGVFLVARQKYCTYAEFTKAVESIRFAGANILGVAINGARDSRRKKRRYDKYGYYYTDYKEEPGAHATSF